MKESTIKIGVKEPSVRQIEVPYLECDTEDAAQARLDVLSQTFEDWTYIAECVNRKRRIDIADRGARGIVLANMKASDEELKSMVSEYVGTYDHRVKGEAGRPRQPKVAEMPAAMFKGMSKTAQAEMAATMAAQGVILKVV